MTKKIIHNVNKNIIHIKIGDVDKKKKKRRKSSKSKDRASYGPSVINNNVSVPQQPYYNRPQELNTSTLAGREHEQTLVKHIIKNKMEEEVKQIIREKEKSSIISDITREEERLENILNSSYIPSPVKKSGSPINFQSHDISLDHSINAFSEQTPSATSGFGSSVDNKSPSATSDDGYMATPSASSNIGSNIGYYPSDRNIMKTQQMEHEQQIRQMYRMQQFQQMHQTLFSFLILF